MNLYVTADQIGTQTGGGTVTFHESEALKTLGLCRVIGRTEIERSGWKYGEEPWCWDYAGISADCLPVGGKSIAHFYAGTFGNTITRLKACAAESQCDLKVVYTIAAHNRFVSKREHEKLGMGFPYPHLVQETEWRKYISGYALADVIVAPGTVPARTIREYGGIFKDKRIEIIPHGCHLPAEVKPLPKTFTVGNLGSWGADKGIRYLLEAWKKLAYKDATLVLAGKDSTSPLAYALLNAFGGGNIILAGWQKDVSDFYNSLSLYVQPSATEGFGCETIESMAFNRPVICSNGAGACDAVPPEFVVPACDADALAAKIQAVRDGLAYPTPPREIAQNYTWDVVQQKYIDLWKSLL